MKEYIFNESGVCINPDRIIVYDWYNNTKGGDKMTNFSSYIAIAQHKGLYGYAMHISTNMWGVSSGVNLFDCKFTDYKECLNSAIKEFREKLVKERGATCEEHTAPNKKHCENMIKLLDKMLQPTLF